MRNRFLKVLLLVVLLASVLMPTNISADSRAVSIGLKVDKIDGKYFDINLATAYTVVSPSMSTCKTGYYTVKDGTIVGYEYAALISSSSVNCTWIKQKDSSFIAGENSFGVMVRGTSTNVTKDLETLSWNPTLLIDDKEITVRADIPVLLESDPINKNYKSNTLEWDYGICVRRLSLTEGKVQETWVFKENPKGTVHIKDNSIVSKDFIWIVPPFAYDAKENVISITADKIVKADDLAKAVYPVTIDPTVTTYTGSTADGYNTCAKSPYLAAWNNSSASVAVNVSGKTFRIGQTFLGGTSYAIYRSYVYFNTAGLPDSACITAVNLSLYAQTNTSTMNITIQNGQPTYPHDTFTTGDYNQSFYSGNGGSLNGSVFKTTGYTNISLNASGISWINLTGTTKFCLRSNKDISATAPTAANYMDLYSADSTLSNSKPLLKVTYILASTVTFGVNGDGYTIPATGYYYYCYDTVVNISAIVNPCSHFVQWADSYGWTFGDPYSANTTLSVIGDGATDDLTAIFSEDTTNHIVVFNSTPIGGHWLVPLSVDYVIVDVVAGGGSGGSGGGGGGGGFREFGMSVTEGTYINVTVGNGGIGGGGGIFGGRVNIGQNGQDSSFDYMVSNGGGRGGDLEANTPYADGNYGGSGGGGSTDSGWGTALAGTGNIFPTNPIQGYSGGFSGGWIGGGGGGAGEVGKDGNSSTLSGGDGGNGSISSITGLYYGGGGGALGFYGTDGIGGLGGGGNAGVDGAPNTGGGGGASTCGALCIGNSGGSGVVIISYFSLLSYDLTLTPNPMQGGNPYTSWAYPCGTSPNIFANANNGWWFDNWSPVDDIVDPLAENTSIAMWQNRSVTCNYYKGILEPPTNLNPTINGTSCFNMSWAMGGNSSGTVIIACRDTTQSCGVPDLGNLSDGCWVLYNGSGTYFNDSCGLDLDLFEYHITAWGTDGAGDWSMTCADLTLGGAKMVDIMLLGILLFVGLVFFIISLWQRQWWIFMVTGLVWVIIMAYIFTQYSTADMEYWVGYVALIMAIVCGGCVFWFREKHETINPDVEESQEDKREKRSKKLSGLRNLGHKVSGKDY